MKTITEKFEVFFEGTSFDRKTNKWGFRCLKCKKYFNPPTTMLASQVVECRCGEKEEVNYNRLELT